MNQSTLRQLPDSWVERIFARLHGIYGNRFANQWDGADIQNVKQVWAEELAGFADLPDSIAYGLKNLDPKFPPSALEFKEICRKAPRKDVPALPHHMTPEEKAKADQAASVAIKAMKQMTDKDHLLWARRPRSALAFNAVLDLVKKGDERFKEILAELIKQGVTDGHKLLMVWNGNDWERA